MIYPETPSVKQQLSVIRSILPTIVHVGQSEVLWTAKEGIKPDTLVASSPVIREALPWFVDIAECFTSDGLVLDNIRGYVGTTSAEQAAAFVHTDGPAVRLTTVITDQELGPDFVNPSTIVFPKVEDYHDVQS